MGKSGIANNLKHMLFNASLWAKLMQVPHTSPVVSGWNLNTAVFVLPKVTELSELERTLEDHLVQLLCNEQGFLQLHQVLKAPQPDLGCPQGWAGPGSSLPTDKHLCPSKGTQGSWSCTNMNNSSVRAEQVWVEISRILICFWSWFTLI